MSGSIFGDDDDFELVGGSDTPSAIRKPPAATPAVRPVAPRTPSTPSSTSGESKNTGNRNLPAVANPSALPRPQLPSPVSKEIPSRRARPEKLEPGPIAPKPAQERRVETAKPPVPPVREIPSRDTPHVRTETPAVAPVDNYETFENPYIEERPASQSANRYVERENSAPSAAPTSRRSARSNHNGYDDYASNENAVVPSNAREESPKSLYSQTPYTPQETQRQPRTEQPLQPYPEVRTSPVVERPRQDAPVEPKAAPTKTARSTKAKKEKVAKEKGPSSFSGGRAGVVVVRVFAIAVVTILMLAGGKSIFFPPQIPDPTTVTNVVKKRLGVTNFPAESGSAFVTSFAKLYLTVDPASPNSNDVFAPYMNSSLAANMTSSNGTEAKQVVTDGPIISGIKSVDDSNAIYTVAAKLNSGANWIYVDVPVYYDGDSVGFAISGMPAFAPAPTKITAPPAGSPFEQDTKLADDVKTSVMEQFFPAWAASNTAAINLIVLKDANSEAKIGLGNSVKFASIQAFTVEQKQPDDPEENTRKAQATIKWTSAADPKITYTQQYNLVLFRQPDNRWYVKELTSGVRS